MVGVRVFGGFAVVHDQGVIDRFPTARCREALAFLALAAGDTVPRRWLIENVWPGQNPESCGNRLSVTLTMLRRCLEDAGVQVSAMFESDRHALSLSPNVDNEWVRFWSLDAQARSLADPTAREQAALALLALHRAPLLVEVAHEWAAMYRLEALNCCRDAANWLAVRYLQQGLPERAEVYAAMASSGQFGGAGLARAEGFEPPTPSSEDWCSIH